MEKFGGGGLPQLELQDGTIMGESMAVLRFLGTKLGYYPSDPMEMYICNCLVEAYNDVFDGFHAPFFAPEDKKAAPIKDLFEKKIPYIIGKFNERFGKAKWLAGDKITIADFCIGKLYTDIITHPELGFRKQCGDQFEQVLAKNPNFKAYGEQFAKENEKWLSERGKMPL